MGIMYAYECDLCKERQVEYRPTDIKGKTYTENGITKFSCASCDGKLKAALALGKDGLDDPLKHVGRLLAEKDEQLRLTQSVAEAKTGGFMGVAEELRRKRESGGHVPVLGLDFQDQYNAAKRLSTTPHQSMPALPAPKKKKKKKEED